MRRDLRRAALFFGRTPFWAALSKALIACWTEISASPSFPVSISRRDRLTRLRARERWIWLCCRFRSLLRMRLMAERSFAKVVLPFLVACGM